MCALLKATGLTKHYARAGEQFFALNGIDLLVEAGEFICITGHSGSGKSTLLSVLGGLLAPDEGTVFLGDTSGDSLSGASHGASGDALRIVSGSAELYSLSDRELSRLRNRRIGYMPQGSSLLTGLDLLSNVLLPFYLYKGDGDVNERAQKLLESMGIAHLAAQHPEQLSGGEARRASIARALINQPDLLLADEPTGDLDQENSEQVMRLFARVADQGTAVIVVTHEQENLNYATSHLTMRDGVIIAV
jgi:putative ABC transport system ATP-binding protein